MQNEQLILKKNDKMWNKPVVSPTSYHSKQLILLNLHIIYIYYKRGGCIFTYTYYI